MTDEIRKLFTSSDKPTVLQLLHTLIDYVEKLDETWDELNDKLNTLYEMFGTYSYLNSLLDSGWFITEDYPVDIDVDIYNSYIDKLEDCYTFNSQTIGSEVKTVGHSSWDVYVITAPAGTTIEYICNRSGSEGSSMGNMSIVCTDANGIVLSYYPQGVNMYYGQKYTITTPAGSSRVYLPAYYSTNIATSTCKLVSYDIITKLVLNEDYILSLIGQPSVLKGKSLYCCGDSETYCITYSDVSWGEVIANEYGMTNYNYGSNGSTLAVWMESNYYTNLMNACSSSNPPDYVVIMFGVNDANKNNTSLDDFCASLYTLCDNILTASPSTKILVMSPWKQHVYTEGVSTFTMEELSEKLEDWCLHASIAYLDNFKNSPIFISRPPGWEEKFPGSSKRVALYTNESHLSTAGVYYVANEIASKLKTM